MEVGEKEVEAEAPTVAMTDEEERNKIVSPYDLEDGELAKVIRAWFKEGSEHKSDFIKRRKRDHEMYGGDQWDESDLARAKAINKPALTLNLILSIVSAVEGEERDGRQDIKFYGVGAEDDEDAQGLTKIVKWIMDGCGGEFELSTAFRNMLIGGEDWISVEVDYFDDPDGQIQLCQTNDDEVVDDALSRNPVARDSRYWARSRMMPEDEMRARWPDKIEALHAKLDEASVSDTATDGKGYRDIYMSPGDSTTPKVYDAKGKQWSVIECWWYQVEPGVVCLNEETGLLEELSPEDFEAKKEERLVQQQQAVQQMMAMPQMPPLMPTMPGVMPMMPPAPEIPPNLQYKERPIKRFYQAFISHDILLKKNPSPLDLLKRFPHVPIRGLYKKSKNEWFGIVRSIIDPQLQHNVEQSVMVQLQQLMPKNAWMGPRGSFHNKQDWMQKSAQPGAMLEYDKRKGKPEQITPAAIPRHLVELAFTRPQAMRDISGVNHELTGNARGSDTGVVIEKRTAAAKTVLTPIFDNYRRSKIELGKVLLAYIQKYISPGRVIRVLGSEGKAESVIMSSNMKQRRYDITVDQADSQRNERFEALHVMQTTLPQMMKAGVPLTPAFVDLLPLPTDLRDEWKRQIEWQMTQSGMLPPPNWKRGDPIPMQGMPPAPPQQ